MGSFVGRPTPGGYGYEVALTIDDVIDELSAPEYAPAGISASRVRGFQRQGDYGAWHPEPCERARTRFLSTLIDRARRT